MIASPPTLPSTPTSPAPAAGPAHLPASPPTHLPISVPASPPAQVSISSPDHLSNSPPVQVSISSPPLLRTARPAQRRATTAHSPLPTAPDSAAAFLAALLSSNFNLPLLAAQLDPEKLLEFIADPAIHKKLQSILDFNTICICLRQAQARHVALAAMQSLVEESTDDLEKRRAATSLLRATAPPRAAPKSGSSADDSDEEDAPRPPRPSASPRSDLTAEQVVQQLRAALREADHPEPNSGLATVAAFCDHDAALNDEPLPTDNPAECIEALEESPVASLQGDLQDVCVDKPVITDTEATIPTAFACRHKDTPLALVYTLRRRPDSKHPNCWLITKLTTYHYHNTT